MINNPRTTRRTQMLVKDSIKDFDTQAKTG